MAGWTVVPNGDTSAWKPVQKPASNAGALATPESPLKALGTGALDLAKGFGEGALNTISSTDDFARKHLPAFLTNSNLGFGPPANLQHVRDLATPADTTQTVGKGLEQIGEFLLPTGVEEGAAKLGGEVLGKGGEIAGKLLGSAAHSGAVNKVQGGGFGTGALLGAGGSAVGEGLKAAAPLLAESALGVRGADKIRGRTVGDAILNETTGVRPATVLNSAQERLGELNTQNENLVRAAGQRPISPVRGLLQAPQYDVPLADSPTQGVLRTRNPDIAGQVREPEPSAAPVPYNPVSLAPARQVATEAMGNAAAQNTPGPYHTIENLGDVVNKRFLTGEPIPEQVSPMEGLLLKRGIGNFMPEGSWNPESVSRIAPVRDAMYGSMMEELERAVPETADINQRISSLLPVTRRAEMAARAPGVLENTMNRFRAPTGALTGAVGGGVAGYHEGGLPGAVAGAGMGALLPSIISSPTTQMIMARGLYDGVPKLIPAAGGAVLQTDRETQ